MQTDKEIFEELSKRPGFLAAAAKEILDLDMNAETLTPNIDLLSSLLKKNGYPAQRAWLSASLLVEHEALLRLSRS